MLGDVPFAVAMRHGSRGTVTRLVLGQCLGSQRGSTHAAEIATSVEVPGATFSERS
jgi:hypothetical protein